MAFDWNDPGDPVAVNTSDTYYLDANDDGGYAFLDSTDTTLRAQLRSYAGGDTVYAVEVINDYGFYVRGYICNTQVGTFGPPMYEDSMEEWDSEGPDPAGALANWGDSSYINTSSRRLSKDTVIYNTAGSGTASAKYESIGNDGATSFNGYAFTPNYPDPLGTIPNAFYEISVYARRVSGDGNGYMIVSVSNGFNTIYEQRFFTATDADFEKITISTCGNIGETRGRVNIGVDNTVDSVANFDDALIHRVISSDGVSICDTENGSGEGDWEDIETGWESRRWPYAVRIYEVLSEEEAAVHRNTRRNASLFGSNF